MMIMVISSCYKKKDNKIEILKDLFAIYENGEIDECKYNSMTVFIAGINAYDTGIFIRNSSDDENSTDQVLVMFESR